MAPFAVIGIQYGMGGMTSWNDLMSLRGLTQAEMMIGHPPPSHNTTRAHTPYEEAMRDPRTPPLPAPMVKMSKSNSSSDGADDDGEEAWAATPAGQRGQA